MIMIKIIIALSIIVNVRPKTNSSGAGLSSSRLFTEFKFKISKMIVMLIRKMLVIKYLMMNAKKAISFNGLATFSKMYVVVQEKEKILLKTF
jgi:hypothetical protein